MHSHLRKETSEILFSSSTVPRHFTPNAGRMDNAVDQVRHALTVGRSGPRRLHSCGVGLVESPSLSQPPPRRLLLLLVPDRTGLALFDLPDAQTFELPAPGAPLSPSCHLASHLLGLPVPQSSLAVNWQRSVAALLR